MFHINKCSNCHSINWVVLWPYTHHNLVITCIMCGRVGDYGDSIIKAIELWNKEN